MLKIKNLYQNFKSNQILHDINLEIQPGEFVYCFVIVNCLLFQYLSYFFS